MEVYIFQAALLCAECAQQVMAEIEYPGNPKDEYTYDSDDYPKGPYSDGGGEADTPQHCDHCGVFLENPLTGDGYVYVIEALLSYRAGNGGNGEVLDIWFDEYGPDICIEDVLKPQAPEPTEAGSPYLNLPVRTEEQARRALTEI